MRKLTAILLAVICMAAMLASCAPTATPTPAKPAPTAAPAPAPAPTTAAPAPAPAPTTPAALKPKYGGIINTWSTVTPPHFDIHRKPSYGPFFCTPVFNNLMQYDLTKNEISTATMQGDLAERWEVSADGKTYTFYLAKGVKWHDGTAFTADDVVYSMEKMVDPKRSSVVGDFPTFDRVEKVDSTTVKMYLKTPSPSFLVMLAGPYASIQPKAKADVDMRSTDFLVGTGPFKFSKYTTGVTMELVKNPDYFKKDASGNKLPYLDGITISIMANKSSILDALVAKKLDGTAAFAMNNQDEWDRVMKATSDFVAVPYTPPSLLLMYLNPNFKPFQDNRVRRGMELLFDKKELTIAGYGDPRWGDFNRQIFPQPYGLSPAEMTTLLGHDKPLDARIVEAKKLFADAGYDKGFKIRFLLRNLGEHQRIASYLADVYKKAGLEVDLVARELTDARKMRDDGLYEVWIDNPLTLIGDPDEFASYYKTSGVNNFTKKGNADADKLWDQQSVTMDLAQRTKLTQEIERLVIKDAWILTLNNTVYTSGWWNYVKGFNHHPRNYDNKQRLEGVWLDK
jgi:peptide/nickel transport system substrate-binding protein